MDKKIEDFRRRVEALNRPNAVAPYPMWVREEAVTLRTVLLSQGRNRSQIASNLGLSAETLRVWSGERRIPRGKNPKPRKFAMVEVKEASRTRPLTLISPNGWRVEGLSREDVCALMRLV